MDSVDSVDVHTVNGVGSATGHGKAAEYWPWPVFA